jgi:flavin reductase (DIM6/NTAB) family NADH-FMN oxidoreductase RutF
VTSVDIDTFRDAMATLAAPLTVLTYYDSVGRPGGLTVSSVCSLSVVPPRVLFCVNQSNRGHDAAVGASHWCLHVLGPGQEHLALRFAGAGDRFRGLPVMSGVAPLLAGVAVRIELAADEVRDGGDHTILLARVRRVAASPHGGGLVWHQRGPAAVVPTQPELRGRIA